MIASLGRAFLATANYLGGVSLLAFDTVKAVFISPVRWRLVLRQILEVGYGSQPVVIITGAFTGAVFAAQTFFQFHVIGMDSAVGAVVSVSMCRELGRCSRG